MKPDWILVADASEARLLQQEAGSALTLVETFHHPASRRHSSELGDDARGRESSDRAFGGSAYEARVEPQKKEHQHFAHELAQVLEHGVQQDRCGHIHLFAGSPFLGELKAALGDAARRVLAGTHDVGLANLPLPEMERRVRAALGQEPQAAP